MDDNLEREKMHGASADGGYTVAERTIYSVRGYPFQVRSLMPRIFEQVVDSIFYLYPSVEAAEAGEQSGGTGFFVAVAFKNDPQNGTLYAVTNAHVIDDAASPVIRVNTHDGGFDVIPLGLNQWTLHPDGDDIAVADMGTTHPAAHNIKAISSRYLITREVIDLLNVGLGDDVYMIGRFIHHEGKRRNKPTVRSGIIGLMPDADEGIEFYEGGFKQEAFLIEMRSISGFSGSPVFFELPSRMFALMQSQRFLKPEAASSEPGPWLIGIDCGNFKIYDKVFKVERKGRKSVYTETDYEAKSHSGYSIVVPAWKLRELLDMEEFVVAREKEDEKIAEAKRRSPIELDSRKPDNNEGITSEGFEEALRRASRKTSSEPDSETDET